MEYKIVKETHPTLKNYGKYKAVAMHYKTVTPEEIAEEIERNCSAKKSDVDLVMAEFTDTLVRHLKDGDRVRIPGLGLAKLEIDSEKVASPQAFRSTQHIHGVKLHLLPESKQGMQELYKDIKYVRAKTK
jgi:nucleoid DNA-binding protein